MKNLFVIVCLVMSVSAFAQASQKERNSTYESQDIAKIIELKNLTYYGWDFRYVLCNDHHFQDPRENIHKITKGWIYYFDKKGYGVTYIEKLFKDKHFTHDPKTIQNLIKNVDEEELINIYKKNPITEDSIDSIVSNYPVEGEGLGLIFIAEEVSKSKHTASAFATIFDIPSRKVLKTFRISGYAGESYGLVAYYGGGFIYSIIEFESSYKKLKRSLLKLKGSNN